MWFSAAVVFVPSFLDTVQRPALPHAVCPRGPLSRPLMRPPDRCAHPLLGARWRESRPIAFCSFSMQRQRRRSSRLEHAAQPIQGAKGRLWLTLGRRAARSRTRRGRRRWQLQRWRHGGCLQSAACWIRTRYRIRPRVKLQCGNRDARGHDARPRRQRSARDVWPSREAGRGDSRMATRADLKLHYLYHFVSPSSHGRVVAVRRVAARLRRPASAPAGGLSAGPAAGRFIIYYRFLRLYRAVALTRQRETRCVHRSPRASTVARARKRRR